MRAVVGFAGFGGVDIALRESGFEVVGIELDPDIAQVNIDNGGNIIIADIRDIDPIWIIQSDYQEFILAKGYD